MASGIMAIYFLNIKGLIPFYKHLVSQNHYIS